MVTVPHKMVGIERMSDYRFHCIAQDYSGILTNYCLHTCYHVSMHCFAILTEYGELSSELKEYFKSFVDNDRVVRREDIENFFESMTRKKRRKIEEGLEGMPSTHCHY